MIESEASCTRGISCQPANSLCAPWRLINNVHMTQWSSHWQGEKRYFFAKYTCPIVLYHAEVRFRVYKTCEVMTNRQFASNYSPNSTLCAFNVTPFLCVYDIFWLSSSAWFVLPWRLNTSMMLIIRLKSSWNDSNDTYVYSESIQYIRGKTTAPYLMIYKTRIFFLVNSHISPIWHAYIVLYSQV